MLEQKDVDLPTHRGTFQILFEAVLIDSKTYSSRAQSRPVPHDVLLAVSFTGKHQLSSRANPMVETDTQSFIKPQVLVTESHKRDITTAALSCHIPNRSLYTIND